MLLANAEAHADNPEFQRDMLSTVRASVARIGRTLAKLQAQEREAEQSLMATGATGGTHRRLAKLRGIDVPIEHDGKRAGVAMEASRFDASSRIFWTTPWRLRRCRKCPRPLPPPGSRCVMTCAVWSSTSPTAAGECRRFRARRVVPPFASTKPEGHGIGAFQARNCCERLGGPCRAAFAAGWHGDAPLAALGRDAGRACIAHECVSRACAIAPNPGKMAAMSKPKLLIVEDDEGLRAQYDGPLPMPMCRWSVREGPRSPSYAKSVRGGDPRSWPAAGSRRRRRGFALLDEAMQIAPELKVVVVTGNGERAVALRAISRGAFDFTEKPADLEVLRMIIDGRFGCMGSRRRTGVWPRRRAAARSTGDHRERGYAEGLPQHREAGRRQRHRPAAWREWYRQGGTGSCPARSRTAAQQPFVAINCGAIPENLLESELFGHEKGAFTGAIKQTNWQDRERHRGTLFLDEIGDLPLSLQVKLLRFLQDQVIERVGGRQPIQIDVRIVSATNVTLEDQVAAGRFRQDLYYRMNSVTVRIPPLRDRARDCMLLANYFLNRFNVEFARNLRGFQRERAAAIMAHRWPGNVRELENRVKRAVVMTEGRTIEAADLELAAPPGGGLDLDLRAARLRAEREVIQAALARCNGTMSAAAKLLG